MALVGTYQVPSMPRPKGRNGKPKRLYLNEPLTKAADKFSFGEGFGSLSNFTEYALAKELRRCGVMIPEVEFVLRKHRTPRAAKAA